MRIGLFLAFLLGAGQVNADTIAIIGTGDVAAALGPEFSAQGHTIVYGSRSPEREDVQALVQKTGSGSAATSNAEIIQNAAPDAYVVKAFNTLSWRTMIEPDSSGGPVSIPLTGDSDAAKAAVAALVAGMGLQPIDVGPVENSRWVEGMLILWINNRYGSDRPNFDFHLRQN